MTYETARFVEARRDAAIGSYDAEPLDDPAAALVERSGRGATRGAASIVAALVTAGDRRR